MYVGNVDGRKPRLGEQIALHSHDMEVERHTGKKKKEQCHFSSKISVGFENGFIDHGSSCRTSFATVNF